MATFEGWFDEEENFGLRSERFYDDLLSYKWDAASASYIEKWLRAAYDAGREHALLPLQDDGK